MKDHPVAVIPEIIDRHVDEAAFLWQLRQRASVAPNWSLADVADLDERLEAHIDGLRVAGQHGVDASERALESGAGGVFVASMLALEGRERERLARIIKVSVSSPQSLLALASAFGHVEPRYLSGVIKDLLVSVSPVGRQLGIAACIYHGREPGTALAGLIDDLDHAVSVWAIRATGELGLMDHGPAFARLANAAEGDRRFWTAWSLVLLGNRGPALESLTEMAFEPGVNRLAAFRLALQAMRPGAAHVALQQLANDRGKLRWLIQGSGIVGDPAYVPWLIRHMSDAKNARLVGEAFSLIAGVDLSQGELRGQRPEGFESGPNDEPDDPNVDMDEDDGMAWPDPEHVERWWAANGSRFQEGTRYFMGAPVTREHCIDVLKTGYQRQRILAAHYLCLLEPGTPLFNTSAPAWRQQRLLAKMT